ncbi:MAG TPA: nitrate reductase subunit beta [Candidatus Azoamicus sp. OHIO2]
MKIRAQMGMVLNLDKCIGCHTCSVTCKNVWTSRKGVEYMWFNNVETKPGIGYPKEWESQEKWNGGWKINDDGHLEPNIGGKLNILIKLFANPDLPSIDDYYEPFTFNYSYLSNAPKSRHTPTARPISIITGKYLDTIKYGPNWEEILGGEFEKRSKDINFENINKDIYGKFKNTFMFYLPRLCEHCLNPACVAVCPSGAIYKREEDGIVLIDQNRCRGWRMCISACPYKKIYYNWHSGKSEKCIFCYPRIESGETTVCSETCVGRIRSVGVILYDANKILEAASTEKIEDLYENQLNIFLNPHDPHIIKEALKQGISEKWIDAAQNSPIYKMVVEWKVALPLHPEYRTLPMVWYIPPLSPIQDTIDASKISVNGIFPDINDLRIPIKYLANLLTAGNEKHVITSLKKMLAMRVYMRDKLVNNIINTDILKHAESSITEIEDMYRYMAIANYEDRFVIPTARRDMLGDAFAYRSGAGFGSDECNSESINIASNLKNLFGGI